VLLSLQKMQGGGCDDRPLALRLLLKISCHRTVQASVPLLDGRKAMTTDQLRIACIKHLYPVIVSLDAILNALRYAQESRN
jgi:hypothetical protein